MHATQDVRRFNRFYTRRIGALRDHFVGSPHPLPVARLLYEIGQRERCTASELGAELDLDAGYLSRLLEGLRRKSLVKAAPAPGDARRKILTLTPAGRRSWQYLDEQSRKQVSGMLKELSATDQGRLVSAMGTVASLLGENAGAGGITLRAHRPGDMGWVIQRHAELYLEEWGWGRGFEALVAGICKAFLEEFDPARERCWIAERRIGGQVERVGCVFVVDDGRGAARLRLLLVDPLARGTGLGTRLVEECIRFSREKGYRRLVLWTHANLLAARAIYAKTGFRLVRSWKHRDFGRAVTGEDWVLEIRPARRGT